MKTVFMFFVVLLVCLFFLPLALVYTVLDSLSTCIAVWCVLVGDSMRNIVFKSKGVTE